MGQDGKPIAPRELLERLSKQMGAPSTVKAVDSSSVSFSDRKKLEKNRKIIRPYKDSKLGRGQGMTDEVKRYGISVVSGDSDGGPAEGASLKPVDTGQNRQSAGFQEPASRRHDPYR